MGESITCDACGGFASRGNSVDLAEQYIGLSGHYAEPVVVCLSCLRRPLREILEVAHAADPLFKLPEDPAWIG